MTHGYKLPSTFDTNSKYNKILQTPTRTETSRRFLPSLSNATSITEKLRTKKKRPESLPPINLESVREEVKKPSKIFCETGKLDREHGEKYHSDLHNRGVDKYERCSKFYDEYKPSKKFCETGEIDTDHGEIFHQYIHNRGVNAFERCREFYDEYNNPQWVKSDSDMVAGKKRTRRNRKNKKTRKQRRKSVRRNKK